MFDPRKPIAIFSGGEMGYGDATKHPERDGYHYTYNYDMRYENRAVPSLAPIRIALGSGGLLGRISCAIEWEDITTGRPFILVGSGTGTGGSNVSLLRDGTYTIQENADVSSSAPISAGALFRYDDKGGSADEPDTEMVYFSRAAAPGTTAALQQRDKSASYSDSGHTISPYGIYVVGSDLWIVSANGYEIQKWSLDTDPGLSGSYNTAIPVGRPTYPINYIGNVGGSPFPVKGDGIFKYDTSESVKQFISVLNFSSPHKDNGKVCAQDGRGRLYVCSAEGHIIAITPGYQSSQTPLKNRAIDRDTPYGRITAMDADLDWVDAAIEPGQRYTDQLAMKVIADDGGVRTDETSDVTDGQFGTNASVTLLTTGDFIYVGADEPFLGAYFIMSAVRTAAGNALANINYSSSVNTFTAAANSHDSTVQFSQDGLITVQASDNRDLYRTATTPWVKTTAYAGSASKYWMRIDPGDALTGATIAEVRIVPYRPPLDADLFPETAYAIGGALPQILAGKWVGEEIVWHHVWTLDAPRIERLLVANGSCGALPSKRGLYAFHREGVHCMPIGPDAVPARAAWPKLADYGETSVAANTHMTAFSAIDFDGVVRFRDGLDIDMTAVQSDDIVGIYCRWDEDQTRGYQKIAEMRAGRKNFRTAAPEGQGRILYTYLQYSDGSRTAMAPVLRKVTIPGESWDYVENAFAEEANYPAPAET